VTAGSAVAAKECCVRGGLGEAASGESTDGGDGSRLATGQEKEAKGEEETELRGINVIPLSSLSTREAASSL
jgi:hypothetical protein